MENNFSPEQKVKEFMGLSNEEKNNRLLDELVDIQKQEENEEKFSEIEKEQMNILRKEIYNLLDSVNKKTPPDTMDSK